MSTANSAVALLRAQYKNAHDVLEGTLGDASSEMIQWTPPGLAHPIGATYAHIAVGEDAILNGMAQGKAPSFTGEWAGKTGLSSLPPSGGQWQEWSRQVQVDLPALRTYAQAVFATTDAYLGSLTDEALGQTVNLSGMGLGQQTLGWLLSLMLANVHWHTGEIACLKGLQGAKGYPF